MGAKGGSGCWNARRTLEPTLRPRADTAEAPAPFEGRRIRQLFSKSARLVLERLGLERKTAPQISPLTPLEHPWQAFYERGDVAFEVPLDKCRSLLHFSYAQNAWHPFVKTLEQYQEDPDLDYDGSVLKTFYERYRPGTVLEAFLGHLPDAERFAASRFAQLSLSDFHPFFPWDAHKRRPRGESGLGPEHGHQAFGPVSRKKGELEFGRLIGSYDAIRTQGYRPGPGVDGDIRGFFLRVEGDYRFVIRQGLHRTPALSALGHETLRVKFFPGLPRAIFLSDLPEWPHVRQGLLDAPTAERIFRLFFEDDGTRKAQRLGLPSSGLLAQAAKRESI